MSLDFLEHQLGYHLRRASAAMIADLAQSLAEIGLTVISMSVLLCIDGPAPDGSGEPTQSNIGRALNIARANMAPLTAALAEQGLIERATRDGRSQTLALTRAGRAAVAEARRRVASHEARFLPHLPPEERRRLMSLLASIWREAPPLAARSALQPIGSHALPEV